MEALLAFLILCFFTCFGLMIAKLMSVRKISVRERLQQRNISSAVLKTEEKETYLQKLEKSLAQSKTGITIPIYVAIILVAAVVIYIVCYFLTTSVVASLLAASAALFVPRYIIDVLAKRNRDKFDQMFVKALKRMAGSIQAEESLQQAVRDVAESESMSPVIREEFSQVLADFTYDGNMVGAFMKMYERTKSKDVKSVATSIGISQRYNTNLGDVFQSCADTIMERQEMNAEGKAMLANTRMNTLIVSAVPFVFGIAMKVIQPDYFDYAYNWLNGLGKYIIVALYVVDIVGLLYLLKKCDIDVG